MTKHKTMIMAGMMGNIIGTIISFTMIQFDHDRRFPLEHNGLHPDAFGYPIKRTCNGTETTLYWMQADGRKIHADTLDFGRCTPRTWSERDLP